MAKQTHRPNARSHSQSSILRAQQSSAYGNGNQRRDNSFIANAQTIRALPSLVSKSTRGKYYDLFAVEDSRLFSPDSSLLPRDISGVSSPVYTPVVRKNSRTGRLKSSFGTLSSRVVSRSPDRTIVCLRRKRRAEVLHAKGIAGMRVAKPRYNLNSQYHCR